MATASSVSKMLLPEAFTGSNNFESYLSHFEQLVELQNLKRIVTRTETDERPYYFVFILKKNCNQLLPYPPRDYYK